jgi:DNA-binding transcriptional regulator YhcF (GntR family)
MEFSGEKAIFLQIADMVFESILRQKWKPEERLLSTREMAVSLEVNPNTVMRAYAYLQEKEIIFNRRGIGYFISLGAVEKIKEIKREQFVKTELPRLVRWMNLLEIEFDELQQIYQESNQQSE